MRVPDLNWSFLFETAGELFVRGSHVQKTPRVCQARDTAPVVHVPVVHLFEQSLERDVPASFVGEAYAGWCLPSGLHGICRTWVNDKCTTARYTELTREVGQVPDQPQGLRFCVPLPDGRMAFVRDSDPRTLIVGDGISTATSEFFHLNQGFISMIMPVYDDPHWLVITVDEVSPAPLSSRQRGMADGILRSRGMAGAHVFKRRHASYLLRIFDMAFFRIEVPLLGVCHTSILLGRGVAIGAVFAGQAKEFKFSHNVLFNEFNLVPATPTWLSTGRGAAPRGRATVQGDVPENESERTAADAGPAVTPVEALPKKTVYVPPPDDVALLEQFFDPTVPCNFAGCAELQAAYSSELELAGGDNCPACKHDSIKSKYVYRIKELLRAARLAANKSNA